MYLITFNPSMLEATKSSLTIKKTNLAAKSIVRNIFDGVMLIKMLQKLSFKYHCKVIVTTISGGPFKH